MASSLRILVAMSDVSSDGMLAWPALQMLIRSLPEGAQVDLLAGRSSGLLAAGISGVAHVFDETALLKQQGARYLRKQLRAQHYQVFLCLSPIWKHRWLGLFLGIKQRFIPQIGRRRFWDGEAIGRPVGPMRWRRAYEEVVHRCLDAYQCTAIEPHSPYWNSPIGTAHQLSGNALVIVYPGLLDSGQNLGVEQYQQLLSSLNLVSGDIEFVLCTRVREREYCQRLASRLQQEKVNCRIAEFSHDWDSISQLMVQADLVIGAQGPILWLAGAMNIPCVGFGVLYAGAESLRHPLADAQRCLMFSPPTGRLTQEDISLINATDSAVRIRHWFHRLQAQSS